MLIPNPSVLNKQDNSIRTFSTVKACPLITTSKFSFISLNATIAAAVEFSGIFNISEFSHAHL